MNKRISVAVLAVVFCLSFHNHPLLSKAPKDAKMECKLTVQKKNLAVGENPLAEFEIRNTAKQDLIITYNSDPFEFLDLEVTDPAGKQISSGKYGGRFSPYTPTPEKQLRIRPGETYRGAVAVFGNAKAIDRTTPGVYRVIAVFEYNKMRAVAEPVMLHVAERCHGKVSGPF